LGKDYLELLNALTLIMKDLYCSIDSFKPTSEIENMLMKAEKTIDEIVSLKLDNKVLMDKIKIKIIEPLEQLRQIWLDIKKESERKECNERQG